MAATIPSSPGPGSPLGRTLPSEAFSPEGMPRDAADASAAKPAEPWADPSLPGESLAVRVPGIDVPVDGASPAGRRYDVQQLVGLGATGRIYAAHDRNLDRQVAVKLLDRREPVPPEELSSFVDEARITASLQHPNVLPVYDIDVSAEGRVFFSMKMIEGSSLGHALAEAESGETPAAIKGWNAIVTTFLQVANAVSYAHHRGIVHQDIKPDNIMLGEFGEVLLLDWGSAVRLGGKPKLYGTPLYMSPEQARRESADRLSDVYGFGATLFHALTLRLPTWSDDPETFWRRKREGAIDPVTTAERARIPRPLLSIAMKALAAAPGDRYASIDLLARDLAAFQAGQAVSAYRAPLLETIARWHRRHAPVIWTSAALLAALIGCAALLYGEKLKEIASWGAPVLTEDFADERWKDHWTVHAGAFERRGGGLVSSSAREATVVLDLPLSGSSAIEFDGTMLADAEPGDLSVMWITDPGFDPHVPGSPMGDSVVMQVGAYHNLFCALTTTRPYQHLVEVPIKAAIGVAHRIRAEVDGCDLRLFMDGATVCEHRGLFPYPAGYFALYGFYPGKRFGHVAVYSKGLPERLDAVAAVDSLYDARQYERAAGMYGRVHDSHPGTELGDEALYKRGLCLVELGKAREADEAWARLVLPHWRDLARCHALETAVREHRDDDEVIAGIERIWRETPELHPQLESLWSLAIQRRYTEQEPATIARYLELHDRLFPHEITQSHAAAEALVALGRFDEVLRRYPEVEIVCSEALGGLGRDVEVIEAGTDLTHIAGARLRTGLYREGEVEVQEWSEHEQRGWFDAALTETLPPSFKARVAVLQGKIDEGMAVDPTDTEVHIGTLLALGRTDLLEAYLPSATPRDPVFAAMGLIGLRRYDEAWRLGPCDRQIRVMVAQARLLDARIRGDRADEAAWAAKADGQGYDYRWRTEWFERFLMRPFLRFLDGDAAGFTAHLVDCEATHRYHFCQRVWYAARYLLGHVGDQDFLAQPFTVQAPALLALCQGMKGERDGDAAAALAGYRGFLALPDHRRFIGATFQYDPTIERFVRWRIGALEAKP